MAESESSRIEGDSEPGIAIIGLAGRFPGAASVTEFWQNLIDGVESVSFFSDEELEAGDESISRSLLDQPNFVRAKGVLDGVEEFDAAFFGFNPREAELLDPQHRLFLECAWHALEDAGYDSLRYSGRVGVYGGTSTNTYLLNIYSNRSFVESIDPFQLLISSDKDFLTTRVSYKLGLSGPSIAVQTACSTSLVAVHLACQSLLNCECDMALAGGVSVTLPQKGGYLYQEGGFLSPDGHCRAFDIDARGTVSGSGAGIVVLKRLDEAISDSDHIYAVIRGSAINNDASMKAGFTAPSVTAQATVIAEAMAVAGVDADTVSYVETHGTATALGDPVEIAALTRAFRIGTQKTGYCGIGSVKSNIGHLDAAAGAASLIKVAIALSKKVLPASLHFHRPNPHLNLETSPFYVNASRHEWSARHGVRRAGVSSFGIGGTNAHLVLEEAPHRISAESNQPFHLLPISAKTSTALDRLTSDLALFFKETPELNLADAAFTLQLGRRAFEHRRILVCSDARDAANALAEKGKVRLHTSTRVHDKPPIVFMFPGQGSQYPNMGRDLYRYQAIFRNQVDRCFEILAPLVGPDLRNIVYPDGGDLGAARIALNKTEVAQAALFTVEYAAARLWMSWGITPAAMIGHSIGEYVAACLAGVFNLEDALKLVAARGKLMKGLPRGAMLAASLDPEMASEMVTERISLAAINGRSLVTFSGPAVEIEELQTELGNRGVHTSKLHTSHAFHSWMVEAALEPFEREVRSIALRPPAVRYISNLTGTWITQEQATTPTYWAEHLRATVRFSDGLSTLAQGRPGVFLEVGPGRTLASLASASISDSNGWAIVNTLPPHDSGRSDFADALEAAGKLWLSGANIDWAKLYNGEDRRRIPLPGYPFERKRYWIEFQPHQSQRELNEAATERVAPATMDERPSSLPDEYTPPATETEEVLAEIWREVLGIEKIGIYDEFFALRGHSLLALQLIAQVRDTFDVELPLQKFFEAPTIAGLAVAVEDALIQKIEQLSDEEVRSLL